MNDRSGDIGKRNMEIRKCLVLATDIDFVLLKLLGERAHTLGHPTKFPSLVSEYVRLLLLFFDRPLEPDILALFLFDPFLDLFHHIVVVAGILFERVRMHVEIEHSLREGVQEVRVVGNDEHRLLILDQELRQVSDTLIVEIVGRFIKKKDVRILDERRGQKQARLLPARKLPHLLLERRHRQIDRVQDACDEFREIPLLLRKELPEKFLYRILELFARDGLSTDGDRRLPIKRDSSALRFELTHDEFEERAFACAVLTHKRQFRPSTDRKTHLFKKRFLMLVFEGDFLKPENDRIFGHTQNKRQNSVLSAGTIVTHICGSCKPSIDNTLFICYNVFPVDC